MNANGTRQVGSSWPFDGRARRRPMQGIAGHGWRVFNVRCRCRRRFKRQGDAYAAYMRTDELLTLQRRPSQLRHHDELLFQVVHQVHELWLRLACWEMADAAARLRADEAGAAQLRLDRVCLILRLLVNSLDSLASIGPAAFMSFRSVLGDGSGAQSPGWRKWRVQSRAVGDGFGRLLDRRGVRLVDVYGETSDELCRLAEALIGVDEQHALWQCRHRLVAERVLGAGMVGTRGMPVRALARAADRRLFPQLWQVRERLWDNAPSSAGGPAMTRAGRR